MIIQKYAHRSRIVKGWVFMDLDEETKAAVKLFLKDGDTDDLPPAFRRKDYSIYTS